MEGDLIHMTHGRASTLRRAGGLAGLAGTLTLAGALVTSQVADAAGNPNFEGILSAAPPSGFTSSPASYTLSNGTATVNFDVVVKNLTQTSQTVGLHFSADHILTDNGVNVADGQPGQAGITFSGPTGTTQALVAGTKSFNWSWDANETETIELQYTFNACGYYQIDLWAPYRGNAGRDRATLASGFVRILGCTTDPTATPTPTPTGGVAGSSSTPTPTGAVKALSTPSTGAGSGWLTLGGLLVIVGGGLVVASKRGRRVNI
jgi:LPXTG-motif cell wall-anchored protein